MFLTALQVNVHSSKHFIQESASGMYYGKDGLFTMRRYDARLFKNKHFAEYEIERIELRFFASKT